MGEMLKARVASSRSSLPEKESRNVQEASSWALRRMLHTLCRYQHHAIRTM